MHFTQEIATVVISECAHSLPVAYPSPAVSLCRSVCVTIIHIFAICLTFLRLFHRHNISRLWWDDYLAALASIVDCGAIIDLWLGLKSSKPLLDTSFQSLMARYLIGFLCIITVQWATRIALALAFARIFPPRATARHYAICLAILFLCLFIAIIIQAILFCRDTSAWISFSLVQCNFHGEILIFLVAANILSDALLVFSPLYTLRRLRLPDEERRLIYFCFTGSALMSMSCIATTVFLFAPETWEPARGNIRVILGYLEGSVSLIVCNLLVIVTYFYKVFRQERVTETPVHSQPQEMSETDRTSPLHLEEYVTTFNLTEISGAYFTEPTPMSRSDRSA
ncbi:hypothetical protein BYT27DRAFT_7101075 [Phlegmacium glaucopus]|nr:hypothetical protein BYT27DRAFT_7101075 [Phlegmacium glaucopus]